jgi:YD repeat-containing protein
LLSEDDRPSSTEYNTFGRKISMTDPDLGSWTYVYDVFGNLTTQTDARTCVTTITYDDLNRPTLKSYTGPGACVSTPDVTYTYDSTAGGNEGLGRLTTTSNSNIATNWKYNVLGQVADEAGTFTGENTNYNIHTDFDAFGRPLSQTIPSNGSAETLNYGYNSMGALQSLKNTSNYFYISSTTYDAAGRIDLQTLGNGLQTDYDYYPWTTTAQGGRLQQSETRQTNNELHVPYGLSTDTPIPGDYNRDNRDDVAVYRPSNSTFYVYNQLTLTYGVPGDQPIPADYDGNGTTDVAIYRPSTSTFYAYNQFGTAFGISGDKPIPADYNGDGHADIAVYRPSNATFYVQNQLQVTLGNLGDIPIPADYNGDGRADIAVYRPSNSTFYVWNQFEVQLGAAGDIPVPKDYDGDGDTDVAVFRPSNQTWIFQDRLPLQYGGSGDKPAPADYDEDGKSDVAVFQPTGYWEAFQSSALHNKDYYTYDAGGNISQIHNWETTELQTFSYDSLDRLKSATAVRGPAPYTQNFGYDAIGNMTSKNLITYTPHSTHKHAVASLSTGESYSYDANGNMITRVEGGVTYTQTFDAENRLVSVSVNGQPPTQFLYDGAGNLVKKINPDGSKTLYVGGVYEVDKNSSGTVTNKKNLLSRRWRNASE